MDPGISGTHLNLLQEFHIPKHHKPPSHPPTNTHTHTRNFTFLNIPIPSHPPTHTHSCSHRQRLTMKRPLVKQTPLRWFGGCCVETDEEKLQRLLLFSEHGQQQDHKAAADACTRRALRKGKSRCSRKARRGYCRAPGISVAVIPSPALSGAICLRKAARVPHQSALDGFQGSPHSRQLLPDAAVWRVPGRAARGRRGVETPPGPHTPDTRVPAKTSHERSRWGQSPRPVPELLGDVLQHQRTSPRNAITSLFC